MIANVFLISGPSGVGKGTIIKRLLDHYPDLHLAVSATTRQKRNLEKDGIDYFFLDESDFDDKISKEEFVEWCQVHQNRYGTLKSEVTGYQQKGVSVILEIDVKGMRKVLGQVENLYTIFIAPQQFEDLESRLRIRGTETEEVIQKRLDIARQELAAIKEYDYIIINDKVENALSDLLKLIQSKS